MYGNEKEYYGNFKYQINTLYFSNNVDFRYARGHSTKMKEAANLSTSNIIDEFSSISWWYYKSNITGYEDITIRKMHNGYSGFPDSRRALNRFDNYCKLKMWLSNKNKLHSFFQPFPHVNLSGGDIYRHLRFRLKISEKYKSFLASIIIAITKNLNMHLNLDDSFLKKAFDFEDLVEKFQTLLESHENKMYENSLSLFKKIKEYTDNGLINCSEFGMETAEIDLNLHFNKFKSLFNVYSKTIFILNASNKPKLKDCYLNFYWGKDGGYEYSTGELFYLTLLSRIFYLFDKTKKSKIILLLDEAEIGFHPNWQKKYLKLLLNVLPKLLCENKNGKPNGRFLQIILTSHSPFVLSDLPKENVIFLKKGQNGECQVADGLNDMKQTFGANIHTLLSDSFFMDGFTGDFASEKIQQVIDYLNGEKVKGMDDDKAEKIINMIGEPIVKRQLQKQFQYIKQDKEIEALKKRVSDLENKK